MDQKRINYIFSAVLVILALILGYFGMTLPVQPVIPSPLPTPDVSELASFSDLALLRREVEALQGPSSFTVSGDSSYSTDCYQMQGGSTWIADSGCTWGVLSGGTLEIQSGATLDVQSGATVNLPSSTLGNTIITGTLAVSGTTDLVGNISSSTGAVSVTDNLYVSGASDLVGNISSSTGSLTVTDDIYITGAMEIVGAISNPSHYITISDHVDIANTLNYGDSDLYPVGSEDSNFQFSWGTDTITGTAALISQKVDTPTAAWCTISSETFTATHCSTLIVGTTVTVSVWLSDSTASPAGVSVDWLVIGIP